MTAPHVDLWCDGSSTGRVGDAGWAYLLRYGGAHKEASGFLSDSTNNRAELTALLEGLRALSRACDVVVHTDSEYVMKAFTEGWIVKWEAKRWHKVKNVDLWQSLLAEVVKHTVRFEWHRGHSGVADNERVDALCREARHAGPSEEQRNDLTPNLLAVFGDEIAHLDSIAAEARA